MFARKKRSKSGSASIQIIDKPKGYRVIETVGSANNPEEVERLFLRAKQSLTPKRAGELSQNMYELEYTLPESGEIKRQLLRMDADQQSIYDLIRKP